MEELISQPLKPILDEVDARRIIPGAPLLPAGFLWQGREYRVAEVLATWTETGPCHHGSGERYVRKHWWHLRMATGEEMKIYFERQARSARQLKQRWWLYTISQK